MEERIYWPYDFRPFSGCFSPMEATTDNGLTEGLQGAVLAGGDGFWRADFSGFRLLDPGRVRLWRAMEARARGRAGAISLPMWDEWQASLAGAASPASVRVTGIPFSDGALHSDGTGHGQSGIAGRLVSPMALNSREVRLRIVGADPQKLVGSHFSLSDDVYGDRAFRILDALQVGSGVFDVAVWPWARTDYPAGLAAEFARPRCLMRLEADDAMRIARLEGGRFGEGALACVEYPA